MEQRNKVVKSGFLWLFPAKDEIIIDKRGDKFACYKMLTKVGKLPPIIRDSPLEAVGKLRDNLGSRKVFGEFIAVSGSHLLVLELH
jgi:hypothetical protein